MTITVKSLWKTTGKARLYHIQKYGNWHYLKDCINNKGMLNPQKETLISALHSSSQTSYTKKTRAEIEKVYGGNNNA